MKHLFTVALFLPCLAVAQEDSPYKIVDSFPSVFHNLDSGLFVGSANGLAIVKREDSNRELLLDFQAGPATLFLEFDEYDIYDVSTKRYEGRTTSGRSGFRYQTYATANAIGIELNGEWFELSLIDGACDMAINGIDFLYKAEPEAEYLVLQISRELTLTNWETLRDHRSDPNRASFRKTIRLMPGSTMVFAIKRE